MTALTLVSRRTFGPETLEIDPALETERIASALREQLRSRLHRRGLVLGLSGGVDSSVCAALAVRAVGAANVCGLFMPEDNSDPESLELGELVAATYEIASLKEDIGPALSAMGCYRRRDAFIQQVEPSYGRGWGSKLVIANIAQGAAYAMSYLVLQSPDGEFRRHRLTAETYRGLVAATNMKQRTRKQFEYHHADRLNYAVLGTPNRLEYDQGFFVKNGDGAADVKPIAHLYKSQVYQLAAYLEVPKRITARPPTTDTWSLPQTQEEFYFSLPYAQMDLCLYGLNHGVPAAEVATAAGLAESQVENVWRDIRSKRRTTRPLHLEPLLVEDVLGGVAG